MSTTTLASTSRRSGAAAGSARRSRESQVTGLVAAGGIGAGLAVGLALRGVPVASWSDAAGAAVGIGAVAAMLGTYASLLCLVLASRTPVIERLVGHDTMITWHRRIAPWAVGLIGLHVLATTYGYAGADIADLVPTLAQQVVGVDWILAALVAFGLMVGLSVASYRTFRRRVRYETWWVGHLYFYIAVAIAFAHQIFTGTVVAAGWPRAVWTLLYLGTFALIGVDRIWRPLVRSARHRLRVSLVVRESPDTVSVYLTGRRLERFGGVGGQYCNWRFLTRDMWWQAHPYSFSAAPDGRMVRITVKDLGDHSGALAGLQPGTPVAFEGPYGVFTAERAHGDRYVLIGAGVGVAPLRALLDDIDPQAPTLLVYRAHDADHMPLAAEFEALAARRPGLRVVLAPGSRREQPITPERLRRWDRAIASADVFVCGPDGFTAGVLEAVRLAGVPAERVHHEGFSFA